MPSCSILNSGWGRQCGRGNGRLCSVGGEELSVDDLLWSASASVLVGRVAALSAETSLRRLSMADIGAWPESITGPDAGSGTSSPLCEEGNGEPVNSVASWSAKHINGTKDTKPRQGFCIPRSKKYTLVLSPRM